MAGKKLELGPIGEAVASNVKRIRTQDNLTYKQVSDRLAVAGRPIAPLAVRRIEDGDRRVDVDDLAALAAALNVSPVTLLMPTNDSPNEMVSVVDPTKPARAADVFRWLQGLDPLDVAETDNVARRIDLTTAYRQRARPWWERIQPVDVPEGATPSEPMVSVREFATFLQKFADTSALEGEGSHDGDD